MNGRKVDSILGPVYEAVFNKIRPLKSNVNNFSKEIKNTVLLRYWKQLKLNDIGVLIKVTSKNKQLTTKLPQYCLHRIT